MIEQLASADALLVVDVQNDFCRGGALPVTEGDQVVAVLNRWIEQAERTGATIVMTRDWHPPNRCSVTDQGGPWPAHCVAGTPGAAYHPDRRIPRRAIYMDKAGDPDRESYSGFDGTGLAQRLRLARQSLELKQGQLRELQGRSSQVEVEVERLRQRAGGLRREIQGYEEVVDDAEAVIRGYGQLQESSTRR